MKRLFLLLFLVALSQVQAENARLLVAVSDLQPVGVDTSLVRILTDRFRSELIKLGSFQVLERGQAEEILNEQAFQQSGCVAEKCVVEMGQLLGADFIVSGSVGKVGSLWSFSVKLVSVEKGEIANAVDEAIESDLPNLLNAVVPSLAVKLVKSVMGETRQSLSSLGTGDIFVSTSPAGAQVWLDDVLQSGVTPVTLRKVVAGKHNLRVRKEGLGAQSSMELAPNDIARLELALSELTSDLRVMSTPAGAQVWLDGKLQKETTPTMLKGVALGSKKVRLELNGYVSQTKLFDVEYGIIGEWNTRLDEATMLMLSFARPANVRIDDSLWLEEQGTDTTLSLAPGVHRLVVHAPNKDDLDFEAVLKPIDSKPGQLVNFRYLGALDSGFVERRFQHRLSVARWTLFGLSAIAGGLGYYYQQKQADKYDSYMTARNQADINWAWSEVEDARTLRNISFGVAGVLLAGFAITWVF